MKTEAEIHEYLKVAQIGKKASMQRLPPAEFARIFNDVRAEELGEQLLGHIALMVTINVLGWLLDEPGSEAVGSPMAVLTNIREAIKGQ